MGRGFVHNITFIQHDISGLQVRAKSSIASSLVDVRMTCRYTGILVCSHVVLHGTFYPLILLELL